MIKLYLKSLILLFVLFSCQTNKTIFPNKEWTKTSLQAKGFDGAKIEKALAYLKSKSAQDGNSEVLIIKEGYVIYEGKNTLKKHTFYSCSTASV
jgi:hypothetical protein